MSVEKFAITSNGLYRGARLLATVPFAKGEILDSFADASVLTTPSYQTIQVDIQQHVLVQNTLAKLNHSCRPNTFVDTVQRVVIAERDIAVGEQLTFFYPSTEWAMAEPFECHCGFPECIGSVGGAKYLAPGRLAQYRFNPTSLHCLIRPTVPAT